MANIYIQEPPTSGKVLLKTSVGDIDIELWSKECPKTCRNFVQLCTDGYYNDTIFHRVVKGFVVQGGDPSGDGTGGESIYGEPFGDEFHSRLRYCRRGLVGMANSGPNDNGSQFFFTMGATPELQNKNTLFGKVTGDTIFNMLRLEEGLVDQNERPSYPQKIIKTKVLLNPFPDMKEFIIKDKSNSEKHVMEQEKGIKNFGLLSFGQEAEEDEQECVEFEEQNVRKSKTKKEDHKGLNRSGNLLEEKTSSNRVQIYESYKSDPSIGLRLALDVIRTKLQPSFDEKKSKTNSIISSEESENDSDLNFTIVPQEQKERISNEKKKAEIRQEILSLKKQYQKSKKCKESASDTSDCSLKVNSNKPSENELMQKFLEEKQKYRDLKSLTPVKGASREDYTLKLLSKFRSKLDTLKGSTQGSGNADNKSDDWLSHKLKFNEQQPILAKDASTKSDDWYDAYDPRNPLNKRKRGTDETIKNKFSKKL